MDVEELHALTGQPAFSNLNFEEVGLDLVATFDLTVDGVDATNFTEFRSDYRYDGVDRFDMDSTLVSNGDGSYEITIAGGAAQAAEDNRYMFRMRDPITRINVIVSGDFPGSPHVDLVSSQACANCHGGAIEAHYGYNVGDFGADELQCTVCHSSSYIDTRDPNGNARGRFFKVIHGVHNSHNFPSGQYDFSPENTRNKFKVTYPTYMTNCSVCHADADALAAANAMRVTAANCFSCHESMDYWTEDFEAEGLSFHLAFDGTTNCGRCHGGPLPGDGVVAREYVADFHNGLETERVGLIWDGEDLSVTEGKLFTWDITGIVDNGTTLAITWSATYDGAAVNPCNTLIAAGAPGFHAATNGGTDGSMGMLRSYAQGDDFILGTNTGAPGQANNVNLSATNTACAGTVATTTIPVDAGVPAGTRGRVALQGKPQLPLPAGFDADAMHYEWPALYVRVPTPTREWVVGTGALPAETRRDIVDTTQCLKCHVGSLYQHGNTRVDNVDLCVMCHNSASNEKNVRAGMGVTASEAYDGKTGETFEMKTMLHRIHSAGAAGSPPYVIYRNRGIYAWAPEGTIIPNWPTGTPDAAGRLPVFGAEGANALQVHNYYNPTYPRPLNDCAACHDEDFDVVPLQSKAVATTVEAGSEPWINKIDDSLMGAGAAACTSCHKSGAALGHAYQNGWEPTTFENGRQTILDAVP
jgi:OmcA/MtrC family decaheme c-type cytochrome